ncbi:tRNA (adenosine(37)-N6)-threonylcarbamoyltransferase complex transferase subunit TsaD [bacterium]|nr:tRNA (adenosine(37)-N6)-threonylcarbamoyltransferase complex transferase subunit TsaD [bacterium]
MILAVESSCDENSAALVSKGAVLAVSTITQSVHLQFGGVVPELAGRSHLELMDERVLEVMRIAGASIKKVRAVAATTGPGLVGSLLVGNNYAKALAWSLGKPFIPVHHMEAHLWSAETDEHELPLPFLILLVSGGHTMLVLVKGLRNYEVIGSTRDDALGEAYDKVGKLLGLPFPAGAQMDILAQRGNPRAIDFPVAMRDDSFDFSFSGLKTAVSYALRDDPSLSTPERMPDLIASFQHAALSSIELKMRRAVERLKPRALCAAGGVAANSELRERLAQIADRNRITLAVPPLKYCADNAAMIGYLAEKLLSAGLHERNFPVRPRWPLTELNAIATTY